MTRGAGALDREKTLLRADPAVAIAGLADGRFRAGARARAGAGLASDRDRQPDRRVLAAERVLERDFEIVAQVAAALAARRVAPPASAHHVAEQVVENIRHGRRETIAHAALLERGMAVAVVSRAFLRVGEVLIGLVDVLEPRLGLLVAGMPVGMTLQGGLTEGGLQFGVGRGSRYAKGFVKIALRHRQRAPGFLVIRTIRIVAAALSPCRRDRDGDGERLEPARPQRSPFESATRHAASLLTRFRPLKRAAGFLFAYFFLSSSTSRNSASITSSLACPPPPLAPAPASPAALACCALYMASPSFICACMRSLVLALIASMSSPCKAVRSAATAASMAPRSDCETLSPYSLSDFSASWASDSPRFLASTSSRRRLSSAACASASLTIRLMSDSLNPPEAWMRICCSLLVALSLAVTLTMPFASMSKVTSICGTPRGAEGMPTRSNWPSSLLSAAISRSPWKTRIVTAV